MNNGEFNGYSFRDKKMRKEMKFLVILDGDLDVNNAYAFKSKRALQEYVKDKREISRVLAVFEIKDLTDNKK